MTPTEPPSAADLEDLFAAVVDEFTERLNRGERPTVDEYAARYPHLAADLRDVLGMLSAIRPPGTPSLRNGSTAPQGPRGPHRPPELAGFAVERELGRGGMGVVYLARQARLNRPVALKMVLSGGHASAEEKTRFLAEAELIARLQHPHVVQVHEFGADDEGRPSFALEYLPGGSLADRLRDGPLAPAAAAGLVETLARAVGYAHAAGVIHRDLKPANVLFGADGQPKVTDFGLAKQTDSGADLTATGAVLGTPFYMPPEQAAGLTADLGPAADVYSLGAVLYECLTGRPPFRGATVFETLDQVKNREPVAVRELQPAVPRDLDTIALKCLQKDPGRRYTTADALADDLRRFVDGRPIAARPVGAVGRGWRWCRRNRLVVGGDEGLFLWPRAGGGEDHRYGPPERLGKGAFKVPAVDPAGTRVVASVAAEAEGLDLSLPGRPLAATYRRPAPGAAAVSPDGRWVAVGSFAGHGVVVFDAASGAAVATVAADARHPIPAFSPDGRVLVVGSYDRFTFWETGTWEPAGRRDREPGCSHPGRVGFTADGAAAWAVGNEAVLLTDPAGRPLARLPVNSATQARQPLFTPDGRTLAILTGSELHLWDLPALRAGLREVGLDWADAPPPADPPASPAEVRVAGAHRFRAEWRSFEAFVYAPAHIALNPTGPDGHPWLGLFLTREQNNPEAVVVPLNLATLAEPDLPTAYQARIEAYWKLGRWADLVADADRYREVCGPDRWEPERRYYRGAAVQQLGRHREAVADLTAALDGGAAGGVRGLALEARAVSYYATNQSAAAQKDLAAAKQEKAGVVARLQYPLFFPTGRRLNSDVADHAKTQAKALAGDGGAYETTLYALALIRIRQYRPLNDRPAQHPGLPGRLVRGGPGPPRAEQPGQRSASMGPGRPGG